MQSSIFRKSSLEKISSPEQLNDYIKVTNGGVWLLMAALFMLVIAVGVWGFTGSIPDTVEIKGIAFAENSKEQMIYSYVPMAVAKRLYVGMEVQISPEYAPREEYGYIYGVVSYIGISPVTEAEVMDTFDSMQWVSMILPPGNPIEVRIDYQKNASNIQWSNVKGQNITVSNGAYCDVSVITKERKPYELLLR